jgi:hypothetical protein
MKTKLALVAIALSGLVAGSAVAQAPAKAEKPKRECFLNSNVSGFAAQGNEVVNLRVGVKDFYRLDLMGPCFDVDWNMRIALVSRGSNFICAGADAEIISRSEIGPQRCMVKSIRKLTPVEVAALPKGSKP